MTTNRRDFLRVASAMLATSASAPLFLKKTARATVAAGPINENVLVVLQLTGGNDGLNTVVPFTDENYRRLRPTIHLADAKLHRLNDRVGFHPSLGGWKQLLDKGQAAVIQSVGYPNPNRSHFESMAVWHTAPDDAQLRHSRGDLANGGWLARAIDQRASAAEQAAIIQALRIGEGQIPDALLGCRVQVPSLTDVAELQQSTGLLNPGEIKTQVASWQEAARNSANPLLQAAAESSLAVYTTAERIKMLGGALDTKGDYPDSTLGNQLRLIGQFLRAGFSPSIYYTEIDGFDTHSDQLNSHGNRLQKVGTAVRAFIDDVSRTVSNRKVLLLVFSEFGRRLAENGSRGTDHGTAAPVFLFGSGVAGGVHGPYPNLVDLVDDDPVFAIDFRRVYATVLEKWLGLSSKAVLGSDFELLDVLSHV
jgi:uncharacterized protein (DUF1501 family)